MVSPRSLLILVVALGACADKGETVTGSAGGSSSSGGSSTGGVTTGPESPWGEEYGGHYKPPYTGCLDDEAEDQAGRGFACLPKCVAGLCPPAPPGTVGEPACEIDLDDAIPGPDHCVITCSKTEECQGEGYTCNPDGWCSWP